MNKKFRNAFPDPQDERMEVAGKMAEIIHHTAAETGSARESLNTLNDLLSSVCISPPVEESVTRLLDLAAYVVAHYAQEEALINEDTRKYRKATAEKPEMEGRGAGRKNPPASGSKRSDRVRNGSSFQERLIAEYRSLQDLVETKSREIFDRLGQLLGSTVSRRLQREDSSGNGTIYLDADDQLTRDAEFEGENGFFSDRDSQERDTVENNDDWGNSADNQQNRDENGWGNENGASDSWNRDSGQNDGWGNENRETSGWGSDNQPQDSWTGGNEASGGWGNENGGNNGWTSGNGANDDHDRQDDRNETNDGWGNETEQDSGGNSDGGGNNGWGNGNDESSGWGNSGNAENGWTNSQDASNGWGDKTPTNDSSLLTEDLSDAPHDARKDNGRTRHYPDDEFEFSQATVVSAVPPYRRELNFSGYKWHVKHSEHGLDMLDARNVWVDKNGQLHLKLAVYGGRWCGAYIYSDSAFGFGDYTFGVIGNISTLDPHVAFGMASYLEKTGRNAESIQMTFAKWGDADEPPGEYVVQPNQFAPKKVWFHKFNCQLEKTSSQPYTVHKMYRDDLRVLFRSTQETIKSGSPRRDHQFAGSVCVPQDTVIEIPQRPMPVHFSLSASIPPTDGEEVEMIIPSFEFRAL